MAAKRTPSKNSEDPEREVAVTETREQMRERKLAAARQRAKEKLERIHSTMSGSSDTPSRRLRGVPRAVEANWEITSSDIDSFDRSNGVSKILDDLGDRVHPEDRTLVFGGLAAAFGFHDLSKIIDQLEYDDGMEDVAYELKRVRVGFELAMQAIDRLLKERGLTLDRRSLGGKARWANDPTQAAKCAIENEWNAWQADRSKYRLPKNFRIAMLQKYPVTEDGTLKNWMSQWGKAAKKSRS